MFHKHTEVDSCKINYPSYYYASKDQDPEGFNQKTLCNRVNNRLVILQMLNSYFKEKNLDTVRAYLAGGSVRDLFLGYPTLGYTDNDIFITDSAKVQELYEEFDIRDVRSFILEDVFKDQLNELNNPEYAGDMATEDGFTVFERPDLLGAGHTQIIFRNEKTIEEIVGSFHWELVKGYYDIETDAYYIHEEMQKALDTREVKRRPINYHLSVFDFLGFKETDPLEDAPMFSPTSSWGDTITTSVK